MPDRPSFQWQAENLSFKNKKMGGAAAHFLIFERAC
jgi:hypothetical protein